MNKNLYFQKGQISKVILIVAGAVLAIVLIIFIAIGITSSRSSESPQTDPEDDIEIPKPVYEETVGDIRFIMQSSLDLGSIVKSETSFQRDLVTTERFIKVTIGAQNKGKTETTSFAWELGNIIDSEGRNFIPITSKAYYFLPQPDLCGAILKPEFSPVSCVRMYEVSRKSQGLKIQVISKSPKQASTFLDLSLPY